MGGTGDKIKGEVKQAWGKVTGDRSKQAEGTWDKAKGSAKDAAQDARDTVRDAARDARHDHDRRD